MNINNIGKEFIGIGILNLVTCPICKKPSCLALDLLHKRVGIGCKFCKKAFEDFKIGRWKYKTKLQLIKNEENVSSNPTTFSGGKN